MSAFDTCRLLGPGPRQQCLGPGVVLPFPGQMYCNPFSRPPPVYPVLRLAPSHRFGGPMSNAAFPNAAYGNPFPNFQPRPFLPSLMFSPFMRNFASGAILPNILQKPPSRIHNRTLTTVTSSTPRPGYLASGPRPRNSFTRPAEATVSLTTPPSNGLSNPTLSDTLPTSLTSEQSCKDEQTDSSNGECIKADSDTKTDCLNSDCIKSNDEAIVDVKNDNRVLVLTENHGGDSVLGMNISPRNIPCTEPSVAFEKRVENDVCSSAVANSSGRQVNASADPQVNKSLTFFENSFTNVSFPSDTKVPDENLLQCMITQSSVSHEPQCVNNNSVSRNKTARRETAGKPCSLNQGVPNKKSRKKPARKRKKKSSKHLKSVFDIQSLNSEWTSFMTWKSSSERKTQIVSDIKDDAEDFPMDPETLYDIKSLPDAFFLTPEKLPVGRDIYSEHVVVDSLSVNYLNRGEQLSSDDIKVTDDFSSSDSGSIDDKKFELEGAHSIIKKETEEGMDTVYDIKPEVLDTASRGLGPVKNSTIQQQQLAIAAKPEKSVTDKCNSGDKSQLPEGFTDPSETFKYLTQNIDLSIYNIKDVSKCNLRDPRILRRLLKPFSDTCWSGMTDKGNIECILQGLDLKSVSKEKYSLIKTEDFDQERKTTETVLHNQESTSVNKLSPDLCCDAKPNFATVKNSEVGKENLPCSKIKPLEILSTSEALLNGKCQKRHIAESNRGKTCNDCKHVTNESEEKVVVTSNGYDDNRIQRYSFTKVSAPQVTDCKDYYADDKLNVSQCKETALIKRGSATIKFNVSDGKVSEKGCKRRISASDLQLEKFPSGKCRIGRNRECKNNGTSDGAVRHFELARKRKSSDSYFLSGSCSLESKHIKIAARASDSSDLKHGCFVKVKSELPSGRKKCRDTYGHGTAHSFSTTDGKNGKFNSAVQRKKEPCFPCEDIKQNLVKDKVFKIEQENLPRHVDHSDRLASIDASNLNSQHVVSEGKERKLKPKHCSQTQRPFSKSAKSLNGSPNHVSSLKSFRKDMKHNPVINIVLEQNCCLYVLKKPDSSAVLVEMTVDECLGGFTQTLVSIKSEPIVEYNGGLEISFL